MQKMSLQKMDRLCNLQISKSKKRQRTFSKVCTNLMVYFSLEIAFFRCAAQMDVVFFVFQLRIINHHLCLLECPRGPCHLQAVQWV